MTLWIEVVGLSTYVRAQSGALRVGTIKEDAVMALYSCGWCKHDVIQPDTHVRVTAVGVDQPKWCRDCRFCTAEQAMQHPIR